MQMSGVPILVTSLECKAECWSADTYLALQWTSILWSDTWFCLFISRGSQFLAQATPGRWMSSTLVLQTTVEHKHPDLTKGISLKDYSGIKETLQPWEKPGENSGAGAEG